MSVLLDTHIWIRWLTQQPPLPVAQQTALSRLAAQQPPSISAISLWEVQMLHAKGRLPLDRPFERWIRQVSHAEVVRILPLDVDVVIALDHLDDFHGDPADRLIVATALAHGLPLATEDRAIRRSRRVDIWKPSD